MEPLTADDPRQVSVFRLRSRLGAGGMGRVYLASSPGGRAVAVKVVHPELARDPEFMQRFRREVEAAEAVSGVYTAPVVDAGPDDDPPWLATAYVPGPSLSELVRAGGPLPEAAVWRLAGGLVEALQAIHARGLVHRDLKPGNILIAADGPRVIDFGISRALHGMSITATQTTMGTPAYMSPEQAESREIAPASDIFSLGSVLAFAATGTTPFEGGQMLAIIYRIVHADPDLSLLPPALGDLVAGCLAKDPASRPTLGELMGAVTAGAASFPWSAPGQFWPDPVAAAIARQAASVPLGDAGGDGPAGTGSGGHAGNGQAGSGGWADSSQAGNGQAGSGHAGNGGQMAYVTTSARPLPYPGPVTYPAQQAGTTAVPAPGPGPGHGSGRRWVLAIGGAGVAAAAIGATLALVASPGTASPAGQAPPSHSATAAATQAPASTPTPARPGPTAASTSGAPIAVTVCTFPADGCTDASAAQYMEVRPKEISVSGDSTGDVTNLVWSNWGSSRATATGMMELDRCDPNCAQGKVTPYPATVTLAGLKPYGTSLEAYSTIVVQSPAANTTETYTKDTVPVG